MRRAMRLRFIALSGNLVFLTILICCASKPVPPPVETPKVSQVLEEVAPEQVNQDTEKKGANPLVSNINEKLNSLGYEALGLSFESDETLLLLGSVFDSPITHNRQIKIIYTGLMMSYDEKHQSLTINTSKNLASILSFIDKNVPKQIEEAPESSPSQQMNAAPIAPSAEPVKIIPAVKKKLKSLKKQLTKKIQKPKRNAKKQRTPRNRKVKPEITPPAESLPEQALPQGRPVEQTPPAEQAPPVEQAPPQETSPEKPPVIEEPMSPPEPDNAPEQPPLMQEEEAQENISESN